MCADYYPGRPEGHFEDGPEHEAFQRILRRADVRPYANAVKAFTSVQALRKVCAANDVSVDNLDSSQLLAASGAREVLTMLELCEEANAKRLTVREIKERIKALTGQQTVPEVGKIIQRKVDMVCQEPSGG